MALIMAVESRFGGSLKSGRLFIASVSARTSFRVPGLLALARWAVYMAHLPFSSSLYMFCAVVAEMVGNV